MKKVDLQKTKPIDVHRHPFLPNKNPYNIKEFLDVLSLSVNPDMFKQEQFRTNDFKV